MRHVKGNLFMEYVRMIRGQKSIDWTAHLEVVDFAFLKLKIDVDGWYPMDTFERFGNGILRTIAQGDLQLVRMWGRYSVDQLLLTTPALVVPSDPRATLVKFHELRATYFDFDALGLSILQNGAAVLSIAYTMGMPAEEAAAYQTQGFFERLLELSGAAAVDAHFEQQSWAGDAGTLLALHWR